MRLKTQKKYICILLILTMLLSGICSSRNKTDSFFSDACQPAAVSITNILSHAFSALKACTNEMLGHQETMDLVRRTERPAERAGAETFSCSFFMALPPQHRLTMLRTLPDCLSSRTDLHMVIIQYVHHQDGQKG